MLYYAEIVLVCYFIIFFFFQAEDGIRDLVRSRGLGDVYKRQPRRLAICWPAGDGSGSRGSRLARRALSAARRGNPKSAAPVSYTHLTLPTIYSV